MATTKNRFHGEPPGQPSGKKHGARGKPPREGKIPPRRLPFPREMNSTKGDTFPSRMGLRFYIDFQNCEGSAQRCASAVSKLFFVVRCCCACHDGSTTRGGAASGGGVVPTGAMGVQHACPYGALVPAAGLCGGGSTHAAPERLRRCYTRSCVVLGAVRRPWRCRARAQGGGVPRWRRAHGGGVPAMASCLWRHRVRSGDAPTAASVGRTRACMLLRWRVPP